MSGFLVVELAELQCLDVIEEGRLEVAVREVHQAVYKGVVESGTVKYPSATMVRAEPLPGTVMGGFR